MNRIRGVLVYASGKVEPTDDPFADTIIKKCECCAGDLFFRSTHKIAEDRNTMLASSSEYQRMKRIFSNNSPAEIDFERTRNEGCVVYVQVKSI